MVATRLIHVIKEDVLGKVSPTDAPKVVAPLKAHDSMADEGTMATALMWVVAVKADAQPLHLPTTTANRKPLLPHAVIMAEDAQEVSLVVVVLEDSPVVVAQEASLVVEAFLAVDAEAEGDSFFHIPKG